MRYRMSRTIFLPWLNNVSCWRKLVSLVSDVICKRPTRLEGDDGMKLWINQFCGFFFKNIPNEWREDHDKSCPEVKKYNLEDGKECRLCTIEN